VTPLNAAGAGPPSARRDFVVGGCTAPPPPVSGLRAQVTGTLARLECQAAPDATSYLGHAGSAPGGADLYPLTDLGPSTTVQAYVAPGFRGWVRIYAANACGLSAGQDVVVQ